MRRTGTPPDMTTAGAPAAETGPLAPPAAPAKRADALRIGVLGLGMAGAVMAPVIATHPRTVLAAAADRNAELRARVSRDHGIPVEDDAAALCARDDIDAVYIATPHQFHRAHAELAAAHGKHIILEKPMALTLADCDAITAACQAAGVVLVVGHTHSFDPGVRHLRTVHQRGDAGRLAMLAMWNYTDFMYRPRRPEELDTAQGGGILYNQLSHQVDVARAIACAEVSSVRAMARVLDPTRPTEGSCNAFLEFANGATASLVYSGYDRFDSDELHGWIGATGRPKTPRHGATRQALRALPGAAEEMRLRQERYSYGGGQFGGAASHTPHFGLIVASFESADLRITPEGVARYDDTGRHDIPLAGRSGGRAEVLDEFCAAVAGEEPAWHDGPFARGTVATCLAIAQSARERREILVGSPA